MSDEVHVTHCCKKHGCKYGDPDCPVANGRLEQKYECETCVMEKDSAKAKHDYLAHYGKFYKLGLDVHGVIDADPEYFSFLSKVIVAAGGEVHIITGAAKNEKLLEKLKKYDITYTHIFSITDSHKDITRYDENGNPWMNDNIWNRAKGEYCAKENIDMHIDDSDLYGKYFTTPYLRYYKK